MLCGFSAASLFFSFAKIHLKTIFGNNKEKKYFQQTLSLPCWRSQAVTKHCSKHER